MTSILAEIVVTPGTTWECPTCKERFVEPEYRLATKAELDNEQKAHFKACAPRRQAP